MRKPLFNLAVAVITFFIGVAVTSPGIFHHPESDALKFELVWTNAHGGGGSWIYKAADGTRISYSLTKQSFQAFFPELMPRSPSASMNDSLRNLTNYGGDIIDSQSIKDASGNEIGQRAVWEMRWLNRANTQILWVDENGFHTIDCDSRKWALSFENALRNRMLKPS